MARKIPTSAKKRKAQLQEKRAVKRGDTTAPEPSRPRPKRPGHGRGLPPRDPAQTDKVQAARKLQSAFMRPSPSFLDLSRQLATSRPLPRPIPANAIHPPSDIWNVPDDLGCPRRPKWRFDMAKKEVELNEERQFEGWLNTARSKIETWRGSGLESTEERLISGEIKSPSYFELNLEVWRQLWRVTELSSILLVLLDARCPPLHIPPSLHGYITSLKPARQIVFVLTKTGVVGEECAQGWKTWLQERYPGTQVVLSESYRRKAGDEERKGQGSRKHHEPYIRDDLLVGLLSALKTAHQALLEPPEHIKLKPEKLAKWRPRVRESVDWDAVLRSRDLDDPTADKEVTSIAVDDKFGELEEDEEGSEDSKAGPSEPVSAALTIGLIGQPNVGKSSLLNALFGRNRVKASRTPGKTKHFQTLFWTPEIRLVDCPGLVLPNYVSMEIQALCSILPISQIPSMPSCIRTLASLMPLEEIFELTHPSVSHPEPAVEDKRTWRAVQKKSQNPQPDIQSAAEASASLSWSAMDIMTAYALRKGWLTAKAGRPDVSRAGNAILRTVAENRVRWAFWPPGTEPVHTKTRGIWIVEGDDLPGEGRRHLVDSDDDEELSDEEDEDDEVPDSRHVQFKASQMGNYSGVESDGDEDDLGVPVTASKFGILAIDSGNETDESEEGSDSDDVDDSEGLDAAAHR